MQFFGPTSAGEGVNKIWPISPTSDQDLGGLTPFPKHIYDIRADGVNKAVRLQTVEWN